MNQHQPTMNCPHCAGSGRVPAIFPPAAPIATATATAHCGIDGTSYPWTQDCPTCVKEARTLGVSLDRYQRTMRGE